MGEGSNMKINMKETIKLCAVLLRLENVLELPVLGGEDSLGDAEKAEADKELKLLLRCANLALNEIASEYFHLKTSQEFDTADGRINYGSFVKQAVDIYAVKKDGNYSKVKEVR
jgi:hypothetical protein